jgi:Uma2 family endonuclease
MGKTEGSSAVKEGGTFTLEQWKAWPEDERWELIGGTAYCMSPAPRVSHQKIVIRLAHTLCTFLEGKPCTPLVAPVDLFLPEGVEGSEETVVQPDVMVVCDPEKIEEDGIHGAPDFVAEVLSESTAYKDLNEKKSLYERSGVREYWIVNPGSGSVFRYELKGRRYGPVSEVPRGTAVNSSALPGFAWRMPQAGKNAAYEPN